MLKLFSASLIAAMLAVASLAGVHAQAGMDFTLVNATGYPLSAVHVSPSNAESWGEDILGQEIMEEDEYGEVTFEADTDACLWDLKVTFADDDSDAVWYAVDLCSVSRITLRYDRDSDTTSAELD